MNTPDTLQKLYTMAAASPLKEMCGLLTNDFEIIPIINVAQSGQQFIMQKSGYFRALNKLKESGQEIFAVYHSHPNNCVEASQTDIESSRKTGLNYLIITPQGKYSWVEVN